MRIVRETGRSIASIARGLGISEATLGNWCRQDRIDRVSTAIRRRRGEF